MSRPVARLKQVALIGFLLMVSGSMVETAWAADHKLKGVKADILCFQDSRWDGLPSTFFLFDFPAHRDDRAVNDAAENLADFLVGK